MLPRANLHAMRILVIEDEADIRDGFTAILEAEGYDARGAGSLSEGRHTLATFNPNLVLLDLGLPDGNGLDLLHELAEAERQPAVVVITAEAKVETAVEAMKGGAADYLEKPVGLDRLLTTVRLTLQHRGLVDENKNLREQALARWRILGASEQMRDLMHKVERVAEADIPVLITGENGTGKELIARHLHLQSDRYGKPFAATNCAAVPETLIEAEFFGHVRGAFTGADRNRDGLFVEAGEGTLFLDEIGEMPTPLQARLLRVLQEKTVTPVGSTESRPVSCRIVAATNKQLSDEIEAGRFREDLYYRIRGVELTVPALRDRAGDVALLAKHFLSEALSRRPRDLSFETAAISWLEKQAWPGNVRQLQSLVQSAALLLEDGEAAADDLAALLKPTRAQPDGAGPNTGWFDIDNLREFRSEVEKEYLRRKLEEENWNVSATARRIGIRRTNLHERLKQHGLK
ncbi:MAG: Fis family transcriptional regulator [Planctomycetes bacterium]|nr:Fis family transcriptional regulator [Planctomycetota bacterium]